VETVNSAIRYPDALVTRSPFNLADRKVPGVVVVFEVVSPTSGRLDRIIKVRQYAAVPSIRRYIILESSSAGVTVYERAAVDEPWRATTLTGDDSLGMPEIGVEIPVTEFYEDITFADENQGSGLDSHSRDTDLTGGRLCQTSCRARLPLALRRVATARSGFSRSLRRQSVGRYGYPTGLMTQA